MTTTEDYARSLSKEIDTNKFYTLVHSLGNHLNQRADLFIKANILETAIQEYSEGHLDHIDDVGKDFYDQKEGFPVEFKYSTGALYTPIGNLRRKTQSYVIKNARGKKCEIGDDGSDYYIFSDDKSMGVIKTEDMEPFLQETRGSLNASIPTDQLSWIVKPEDITFGTFEPNKPFVADPKGHKNAGSFFKHAMKQLILYIIHSIKVK